MKTAGRVRLWKQLTTRHGAATDHPADEIRLCGGVGPGRRSQMLGASSVFRGTGPWTTVSMQLHDGHQ
ncbi:hypothetical protein [Streptomyces eurythermus]